MADSVKFIHDALGQSEIRNMATEATLKELLEVIGGPQGSNRSRSNSLYSLKNVFTGFKNKAQQLERGMKNVVRPFSGFISLLAKNETAMSAFGTHLNESVIKKLPWVGGIIGSLGDVVISGVGVLEGWERQSKKLVPAGATFNQSIIEMVQVASQARMGLDELQNVIGANITELNALGATTNSGIRKFGEFADFISTGTESARTSLLKMGYNTEEINSAAINFLYLTQRGANRTLEINKTTQNDFLVYTKTVDTFQRLMGDSLQSKNTGAQKILRNAIVMLEMNKLSPQQAAKMAMAAQMAALTFDEGIADAFNATLFGLAVTNDAGFAFEKMLPGVRDALDALMAGARDPDVGIDEYRNMTFDLFGNIIAGADNQLKTLDGLIRGMSVMPGMHANEYEALRRVSEIVIQKNLSGKTPKELSDMLKDAYKNLENTETITEAIRAMLEAVTNFKMGFVKGFTDPNSGLISVSKQLDAQELGKKFAKLSTMLIEFSKTAWQDLQDFWSYLGTGEGRAHMIEYFTSWGKFVAGRAYLYAKSAASTILGFAVRSLPGGDTTIDFIKQLDAGMKRTMGFGLGFLYYSDTEEDMEYAQNMFNFETGTAKPTPTVDPSTASNYGGGSADINKAPFSSTMLTMNKTQAEQIGMKAGTYYYDKNLKVWRSRANYGLANAEPDPFGGIHPSSIATANANPDVSLANSAQLTNLWQKTATASGDNRRGLVTAISGKSAFINQKHVGFYGEILRWMNKNGLTVSELIGQNDSPGYKGGHVLRIATKDQGSEWFASLHEDQRKQLILVLANNGYIDPSDLYTEDKPQTNAMLDALMRGELSAVNNVKNLDSVSGYRAGTLNSTLEAYGRSVVDFGAKSRIKVSGDRAIMTEEQYNTIKDRARQIPAEDMIKSVNSTVQEMISLTRYEIGIEKKMLSVA